MEKLNGKKINTAVFISGRGSNLKSLINFSKKNKSPIKITIVISNNYKAKGLQFCKKYGINNYDECVISLLNRINYFNNSYVTSLFTFYLIRIVVNI